MQKLLSTIFIVILSIISPTIVFAYCGDGVIGPTDFDEQCDNGIFNGTCIANRTLNGTVSGVCSSSCQLQDAYSCAAAKPDEQSFYQENAGCSYHSIIGQYVIRGNFANVNPIQGMTDYNDGNFTYWGDGIGGGYVEGACCRNPNAPSEQYMIKNADGSCGTYTSPTTYQNYTCNNGSWQTAQGTSTSQINCSAGTTVVHGGSASCSSTPASTCSTISSNSCGDGVRDPGEQCDNGMYNGSTSNEGAPPNNLISTSCTTTCQICTANGSDDPSAWRHANGNSCVGGSFSHTTYGTCSAPGVQTLYTTTFYVRYDGTNSHQFGPHQSTRPWPACGSTSSCSNLPANSSACSGTPSPSSNQNYSLSASCDNASACTATCNTGYILQAGSCVAEPTFNGTLYQCASDGNWQGVGSCGTPNYNPNGPYTNGSNVCWNSAPDNDLCPSNPPGTPINGQCNYTTKGCSVGTFSAGSNYGSTIAGITQHRSCTGIDGGDNDTCQHTNPSSPGGACGDGIVGNSRGEECDGSAIGGYDRCTPLGDPEGSCKLRCNGGRFHNGTSCQNACSPSTVVTRGCVDTTNMRTRTITTSYDCSVNEEVGGGPNPGYCCSEGAWTSAPAHGSNPRNYRCLNNDTLAYDVNNGTCGGIDTIVQSCNDGQRGEIWECSSAGGTAACRPVTSVEVHLNFCQLTGSINTYLNCLNALPVNRPAYGYRPENGPSYSPPGYSQARGDSKVTNFTASVYNASGVLIKNGQTHTPLAGNNRLVFLSDYLSAYNTYNFKIDSSSIPPGRQIITGGSAMDQDWKPSPSFPNILHSQGFHSRKGQTFGPSTVVPDALRVSFGNQVAGGAYFYYRCPSGDCPVLRNININTVFDRSNNGFGTTQYDEQCLGGSLVELFEGTGTGGILVASGYTNNSATQGCHIGEWHNLGRRGGFTPSRRGNIRFQALSDRTYTVRITPPAGYIAPASGPYHQVQQQIRTREGGEDRNPGDGPIGQTLDFGAGAYGRNVTSTHHDAYTYTFTVPRDDDIYARTRFIGNPYDIKLTSRIVNPKPGYAPGEQIAITYTLENLGFSTYNPDVEISILSGLVPTGPVVFSGSCPSYNIMSGANLHYAYFNEQAYVSNGSIGGSWSSRCGLRDQNTTFSRGCHPNYIQGMLTTYQNNGNLYTGHSNYDNRFPLTSTETFIANRQTTPSDGRAWTSMRRPRGHTLFMYATNNNASTGLESNNTCDITISYIVTGGALNTTYRTRACAIPQDNNSSPATDEMDKGGLTQNNCSNIDYRIGLTSCTLPASLGGGSIPHGSGVVAWRVPTVTGANAYCESEFRMCNDGVLSGSFTEPSCVKQCTHTWLGSGGTVFINPGSSITGLNTLIAGPEHGCNCLEQTLRCEPIIISTGATADPGGRPYPGGFMSGQLLNYTYSADSGTCTQGPACNPACLDEIKDLYEVSYTMTGNAGLSGTTIIDQVDPNICLKLSSFTGRMASNDVSITIYPGENTGAAYAGFVGINGVTLNTNTALTNSISFTSTQGINYPGYVCGPYIEYKIVNPLFPGARGYFFYEFKLKNDDISIASEPIADNNCVWIYRGANLDMYTFNPFLELGVNENNKFSHIDPGDAARRFVNSTNRGLFSKFTPAGQIFGNNKICVPPPKLFCPPSQLVQKTTVPLSVCGNGVQEIGEQCDDGTRNNDDGSLRYTGVDIKDPLYGNYCNTSCELGVKLTCDWIAQCSNDNLDSIQQGEIYPFWWNLGEALRPDQQINQGFTRNCNALAHSGKIIYNETTQPTCTFTITNGLNTGANNLYEFIVPCIGTGTTNVSMNIPLFNVEGNRLTPGDAALIRPTQGGTILSKPGSTIQIRSNTLKDFSKNITNSLGSYRINMDETLTRGQLGEYEITLTKMEYARCVVTPEYSQNPEGQLVFGGYTYTTQSSRDQANLCSNRFVVTKPYLIQEGSLLSTVTGEDFSSFFTNAQRLFDQSAVGTFGEGINITNTQVPTYISMITSASTGSTNQEFVQAFTEKYTTLAVESNNIITYTHNFSELQNADAKVYTLHKVPIREIYVYTGTEPLFISDSSLNTNSVFSSPTFTLIAPNANIVVFGDLKQYNVMLITNRNIRFAGGSLTLDPQEVQGIFVSIGFDGEVLKNDNESIRWIDDGRLVIRGLVITSDIESLYTQRRSIIKGRHSDIETANPERWGSQVVADRRQKLIEGASLRIIPNPRLFTSPPPGATELLQSLSIVR